MANACQRTATVTNGAAAPASETTARRNAGRGAQSIHELAAAFAFASRSSTRASTTSAVGVCTSSSRPPERNGPSVRGTLEARPETCQAAGRRCRFRAGRPTMAQNGASAKNMRLLVIYDMGGFGNCGGAWRSARARRTARLVQGHESAPKNFTGIDVTDPRKPSVRAVRSAPRRHAVQQLDLMGDLLVVARPDEPRSAEAGRVDSSTCPTRESPTRRVFDASGPLHRGVHHLWFVDAPTCIPGERPRRLQARNPKDRTSSTDHRRPAAPAPPSRSGAGGCPRHPGRGRGAAPRVTPKFERRFPRRHKCERLSPPARSRLIAT